jgi:DNA-binding MarR family transcriptional regulator
MTHQSMGELVAALEQRGYVERRPDASDGRARLICLTAKGREMARVALREIAAIEQRWSDAWQAAGQASDPRAALEAAVQTIDA